MALTSLTDEQLLANLSTMMTSERQLLAKVIAHLIEVEERRLHLKLACPSLLDFCVRRLGLSEAKHVAASRPRVSRNAFRPSSSASNAGRSISPVWVFFVII